MARAPRCFADPAKQALVREEIREFGPVKYMVGLLKRPKWEEERVQEYTAKLQYASRMLDKVSANLRHERTDVYQHESRSLEQHTQSELLDEIAGRVGVDLDGNGADSAH